MKSFVINSKHGKFKILIDDEDYNKVMERKWSISLNKKANYVRVEARINYKIVRLHRYLLNITDSKIKVDHKDRNTLNNQKSNLRICNHSQNMRNCKSKGNKTGYRGVYKIRNKYRACISINNKTVHAKGCFNTPLEAAIKRDEMSIKYSGEFAILNFPKERS